MKIAIIGGGLCGLYLGLKLSKENEVFLFEKKEKIEGKACSSLFSQRIFKFLPFAKKFIQNEIHFCLIHFPNKTIKLIFHHPFFVFNRKELENQLFKLAKENGVNFYFSTKITLKTLKVFEEKFDRIIGCDGACSITRQYLKIKKPSFFLGIQGFLLKSEKRNWVETWPTKNGFFWKIPRGKEVEYGIIEDPKVAKKMFEEFTKKLNLKLENIKSALIPKDLSLPKNQKITLCGDALGLVKPWSGGGVIWGLIGSEILIKNFPDFLKYEKEIRQFFLKQIIFGKLVKKLVYFLGFNFPKLLPSFVKIDGDFLLNF